MRGPENKFRRTIRRTVKKFLKPSPVVMRGVIGNGDGSTVNVAGSRSYIWVRINGTKMGVFNARVTPVYNMPVLIGYDEINPNLLQTLGYDYGVQADSFPAGLPLHGETHRIFSPYGGNDIVWVELRQFLPLAISVNGMEISIYHGIIPTSTGWKIVADTTIDLTASIPFSGMLYTLVYVDTDGVVQTLDGTATPTVGLSSIPTLPDWCYPIAAVKLYAGQTAIKDTASETDIVDLRWPEKQSSGHSHAITLDADADVILDASGMGLGLDGQNANTVLAGPTTGVANEPTFRDLVAADLPAIALNDLSDVDTTGVTTGDVIYKTAGNWEDYPLGVGIDIVNDGGSIKIGNIPGGNFIQIDTDTGEIALAGEATAYEDLRVEPHQKQAAGAGVPSFEKYFDDTPGTSKGVYLYSFTDETVAGNEKELFFTMQMPHAWKIGTDIHMHVHFVPAATVNTSDVIWGLEYTWKGIGDVFGDTTIIYTDGTMMPDDANITAGKHYLAEFADISPGSTASSLSSILICRIFRNSSSLSDTYTNKVGLLYVDAHYQVDSFGSFNEYDKSMDSSLLLETGDVLLLETGDALLME